ncbi:hypothetical protein F5Y03DRAFT_393242 [Xylaria venustula]|nr:hypothetical protein F5Y03DRAFT_393242 [Xylaria venustula]
MFTLPEAKRVRREDLDDSASDSASSDEGGSNDIQDDLALRAKLHAQLSNILNLSFAAVPTAQEHQADRANAQPASHAQQDGAHPQEDGAFAFRLFRDEAPTHTVVLASDEDKAAQGDGGFVVPSRPRAYYVAPAPSAEQTSEYRSVAVTAEYLLADAKRRRWGLEKPWRVIHIVSDPSPTASAESIPGPERSSGQQQEKKKRTRPGKKHRILLRVREREKREREETAKKLALDKEQHLQEKKKRLNRERKLKRRQKEREKKAALQATDPTDGGSDSGGSDGDP